jgi:phage shock protein PspC (stress-responsive transcriptional regulator)
MQTWEVTEYESHSDAGWPADEWTLESGTEVRFLEHEYDDGDVFRLSKPAKISEITVWDYHGHRGEPFLTAIREGDAPSKIVYQDEEYVLAEEDARVGTGQADADRNLTRSDHDNVIMGVCGGIAEWMGVSSALVRLGFVVVLLSGNYVPCLGMLVVAGVYFLIGWLMSGASSEVSAGGGLTHYWVYEKGEQFVTLECWGSNDWDAYAGREVEPYEFDNLLPGDSSD